MISTITISLPSKITKRVDVAARKHGFATRSEFFRNLLRAYFSQELTFEVFKKTSLSEIKLELIRTGKYSEKFIDSVVGGLAKSSKYEG